MRMFLISDNIDTKTGMRLAGISGVVVHTRSEAKKAIAEVLDDKSIGILIITEKIAGEVPDILDNIKTNYPMPLIVEIPDRHGSSRGTESITRYVREAVGIKL